MLRIATQKRRVDTDAPVIERRDFEVADHEAVVTGHLMRAERCFRVRDRHACHESADCERAHGSNETKDREGFEHDRLVLFGWRGGHVVLHEEKVSPAGFRCLGGAVSAHRLR